LWIEEKARLKQVEEDEKKKPKRGFGGLAKFKKGWTNIKKKLRLEGVEIKSKIKTLRLTIMEEYRQIVI